MSQEKKKKKKLYIYAFSVASRCVGSLRCVFGLESQTLKTVLQFFFQGFFCGVNNYGQKTATDFTTGTNVVDVTSKI
jgi:hypothetical protein